MNPRRFAAVLPAVLALLSGLLLALSFPHTEAYLFAWVAFVPLFFALHKSTPSRAFFLGWLCGFAYFLGTVSWLAFTMAEYGKLPWAISTLLMLALVSYLAVYLGLFSSLLRWLVQNDESRFLLFAPALWVILEYAKGHLLSGFPWASLAYSQYALLPMIQIADIGSIYAVGFVIVLVNGGVYLIARSLRERASIAWRPLLLTAAVLAGTFAYGSLRLSQGMEEKEGISLGVIQGNIPQHQKWNRTFQDRTVEHYKALSRSALQEGTGERPGLIIWPEAALPFIFDTEVEYQEALIAMVKDQGFDLLVGAPSMQTEVSGKISLLNSAYLISQTRGIAARYDKMHLVPFGEYVPFKRILFFVNKLVTGISDFLPGTGPTIMESQGARIGTVICYEVIFPDLVRRFVKAGAQVMTTITNDGWFGTSAAPAQHFAMVTFRAIENRVPFARAANSGISGFIDPWGRILYQSSLNVEDVATQHLRLGKERSFYTQYGDLFAALCAIIAFLFLSATLLKRRASHVV